MTEELFSREPKIDNLAVDGLLGTEDSIGYVLELIEHHFHNAERWLGILGAQTATDWADDTLTPFVAISGNNTWGVDANDEAQVLGTDDTPVVAGNNRFDMHRILVTDVTTDTPWKLRFIWGTGTMAAAITAEQFSEVMVQFDSTNPQQSAGIPVDIRCPPLTSGSMQVWCQAWNATDNAEIDFLVGLHEYTVA
jgi:hypothetical protein